MKRIHFKTVIIGLSISLGVELLIPLIQTILEFIIGAHFRYPLTHYLLWGYLAVVLSGIYVGFSKAKHKMLNGILVGAFYYIIYYLFVEIVTSRHSSSDLSSFGYTFLKHTFVCGVVAWGTYRIKVLLNITED